MSHTIGEGEHRGPRDAEKAYRDLTLNLWRGGPDTKNMVQKFSAKIAQGSTFGQEETPVPLREIEGKIQEITPFHPPFHSFLEFFEFRQGCDHETTYPGVSDKIPRADELPR